MPQSPEIYPDPMPLRIRYFFRYPVNGFYSIESLFNSYAKNLATRFSVDQFVLPYPSQGLGYRILNVFSALRHQQGISHITGDVHYLAIALSKRSTILTIHDCGILDATHGLRRWLIWLFWFYIPVKRLRYITVVSEATKRSLLQWVNIDPGKIRVIPNALIGAFTPKSTAFNAQQPVILIVGTTPNKNFDRILQALAPISCSLLVLGILSEAQQTALRAAALPYQGATGLSREEVAALYAKADLLLYPSLLEGFGLPILEAQASGIPVITSTISAMPEIAGTGACFVDPYDYLSIRKGVEQVIQDASYRAQLIQEGRKNILRFSTDTVLQQYAQLYLEVAHRL